MERASLAFTTASSAPSSFLWATIFKQSHTNSGLLLPTSTPISSNISRTRKGYFSVKAVNQSSSSGYQTLSSNWDVSNYAAPSWLPRFEELDTTTMLLRQRIIFLGAQVRNEILILDMGLSLPYYANQQIDDVTADFIITQLLLLDSEDQKKDIRLLINSPGGSVTAGMGIYDAMKLCKADVSTICMGLAASMGAFLLAAGTKGKRYCMPNSRVMIHQPLGTAGGKATEMSIRIREMAYHKVKLNKILSRITGKPEEKIEVDTDRDNFMNAWEAKEYGLVDGVIDDGKPGLVAPIADAAPPPKTRVWDLWKIEGSKKARKNLHSEEKISENEYASGKRNDDEIGTEKEEEAPAPK